MRTYTVIWRDNGDDYMITDVQLGDVIDPLQVSNNEWADLAWAAECDAAGYNAEERATFSAEDGYDLICVFEGTVNYVA